MNPIKLFFSQLLTRALQRNHRFGVVLKGSEQWQNQAIATLIQPLKPDELFCLGGESHHLAAKQVAFNKGHQLLGQECRVLLCDIRDGFDANSLSAATGCVRGGGLVIVIASQAQPITPAEQWLTRALESLLVLTPNAAIPAIPEALSPKTLPPNAVSSGFQSYSQQQQAIDKIINVVEGHRKRPLVMTADRGRGKSSALGMAAAQLMQSRNIHIVLTAPSLAAVKPVFEHAARLLPEAQLTNRSINFERSTLEFVAPDDLLSRNVESDFLLIDEASAIPIPMLQAMVESYHRVVFSTTIHGYEGCGRGFTLKFQSWLKAQRPGSVFIHLDQPIRWNVNDPLEQWLFDSFLLNAELSPVSSVSGDVHLTRLDKLTLLEQPELLRACFALLVNAHYQTTPNDLMLLLADDAIQLYGCFEQQVCIGCLLTVEEGRLDNTLIEQIQRGKRRPKGHLVPVTLANQLGIAIAAEQHSLRIMRIAVHPQLQGNGIGHKVLTQLIQQTDFDYYSTSFGATEELVRFWRQSDFFPVRLGTQRDQASGCHSIVMLYGAPIWRQQAEQLYRQTLCYALSENFASLEIDVVRSLFSNYNASVEFPSAQGLIQNYIQGGASFDSVAPILDLWWKQCPQILQQASPLFIYRVVQRHSWTQCAERLKLAGRKQVELTFRSELQSLIQQVQSQSGD